jgi:AcrR family transcriptional regulator
LGEISTERPRRRQARGERQIFRLLEAAERVFGAAGYAKATTNAIAQEAGVSPGTLYQFFPNKERMGEALSARYVEELDAILADLGDAAELGVLPPERLMDQLVDPFLAFHSRHPAFEALFVEAAIGGETRDRKRVIEESFQERVSQIFRVRNPHLAANDAKWKARVCSAVFKGMLPLISSSKGRQRTRAIRELKAVIGRYAEPVSG